MQYYVYLIHNLHQFAVKQKALLHVSTCLRCVCVCVRVLNANFQEIDEAKTPNLLVIFPSKKSPAKKCSQKSGNILDTIVPKCGFGPISMNSNHQGPHAFLLYLSAPFPQKGLVSRGVSQMIASNHPQPTTRFHRQNSRCEI